MREIAQIKIEILDNNNKLYSIVEQLIQNLNRNNGDVSSIKSSLDTLLKFINKNGK